MRNIKFRVWDNKNKKWIIYPIIEINNKGQIYTGELIEYGTHDEFNEYILSQYTGLVDKNGIEIYEGDIVRGLNDLIYVVKFGKHFDEYGHC